MSSKFSGSEEANQIKIESNSVWLLEILRQGTYHIDVKLSSLISTSFFQGSEVANQILIPIYLVYVFEI